MKLHAHGNGALIDPTAVHSLTDFQRNAKEHLRRLKKSGLPALFTVNGRGAVVMMDPTLFVKLMRHIDELEEDRGIDAALSDVTAGRTRPFDAFEKEFRAKRVGPAGRRRRSA